MTNQSSDLIFLSYAHEDLDTVQKIYKGLTERGLNVWFDKESLGPGRWASKVRKAISRSRYFIICLSKAALRKTGDERPGFQDEELDIAYRIAMDQSEVEFSIVPVRLEDCGRGDHRLSTFNQYDLFDNFNEGLDRLSVDIGGISTSDANAVDERTEDQRTIDNLIGKGLAALEAAEFRRAITLLDSALTINPDLAEVWYVKSFALRSLDPNEEVLESLNKVIEIKPDVASGWANKGISLCMLGRNEEALEAINRNEGLA